MRVQLACAGHIGKELVDVSIKRDVRRAGRFNSELRSRKLIRGQSRGAGESCAKARGTGDHDFDSVRRPEIFVGMQTQSIVGVFALDVIEKIFVRRDAERRRAVAPFNLKSSIGFDFGYVAEDSRPYTDIPAYFVILSFAVSASSASR